MNKTIFDYLSLKVSNSLFKLNITYTLTLNCDTNLYNKPKYTTIGVSVERTDDDRYTFYIEYDDKKEYYQSIRLYYKKDVAYVINELFKKYHNVDLNTISSNLTN